MILKSIAILTVLMGSTVAFGASYNCQIIKIEQTPVLIGEMQIETETGEFKRIVINQKQDVAACGGIPTDQTGKSFVACMFLENGSKFKIQRFGKNKFFALQKNAQGQVSTLTMGLADTKADTLVHVKGSMDMSKTLVANCDKATLRR